MRPVIAGNLASYPVETGVEVSEPTRGDAGNERQCDASPHPGKQEPFRSQDASTIAASTPCPRVKQKAIEISPGAPLPLGVRDCCDGFNFSVFSRHAERVELLLFAGPSEAEPWRIVDLDPAVHRTGDVWHVLVDGITWGQAYAFRVHGPWTPEHGHRFDSRVPLLDPYAQAAVGTDGWACRRLAPIDDSRRFDQPMSEAGARPPKALLVDRRFEWEGVRRPKRPWSETVIYEIHVRGFTIDASSKVAHPGTFRGLVEKIPYLLELGVTAVELMPVQEFDTRDNPRHNDITGEQLKNYWG